MTGSSYYNEIDPYAAQWLRNLIEAGHIPAGDVDERSIEDVNPKDLDGFTQCHFFAGIGGWSYALQLAGWPDDHPVWTGSCPCQPLSSAGQRKGHADKRHLWPAFQSLIAQSKPPVVFGEQVASKDGREWLSAVRADLEELGYACGCADLAAASVGAPHIRKRLWWVAHANGEQWIHGEVHHPVHLECHSNREQHWLSWTSKVAGGGYGEERLLLPDINDKLLAHGVHSEVGRLCAYGNSIVPQVAAQFIAAFTEAVK